MTSRGIIALTGATGFIGQWIHRKLCDDGWRVRALTRRGPSDDNTLNAATDWIAGDLFNQGALSDLLRGAAAVIHCAGLIKARRAAEFQAVNGFATGLLGQCIGRSDSVAQVILLSSLAAREPALSAYAASKRAGEDALAGLAHDRTLTILRPPAVYGPGDRETLALFRGARLGLAPLPGGRDSRLSLIHAADLSAAVIAALGAGGQAGGRFEIDDGQAGGYRLGALYRLAGRHFNRRPREIVIPYRLLRGLGLGNLAVARLFGYRPMLTPGKARELCHPDWVADGGDFTRRTGWQPEITADRGFAQTIDWYRRNNFL